MLWELKRKISVCATDLPKPEFVEQHEDGQLDSSFMEKHFDLGSNGLYRIIIKKRKFSRGKDNPGHTGFVEADHIPPLNSLKRAALEPEFEALEEINPALYGMVKSLENDPRGKNLFTVQVLKQNHMAALSSGNSRESVDVRGLLARRIARGEVMSMLKQAMLAAHPFASRQIRDQTGIRRTPPKGQITISRQRTMKIYQEAFGGLIDFNFARGVITEEECDVLKKYVEKHYGVNGDFDIVSDEYQEVLATVNNSKR
ncbi:unnamed protein product [Gadus morhua 'NCC']